MQAMAPDGSYFGILRRRNCRPQEGVVLPAGELPVLPVGEFGLRVFVVAAEFDLVAPAAELEFSVSKISIMGCVSMRLVCAGRIK